MRLTTGLFPAKYKFKQIPPMAGSWGSVATTTPRKSGNNDSKEGGSVSNERIREPIVAFSKPPPQQPLLAPLLALSLLETWSRRDSDDN
ncbi:hypothetical protein REPUB_Repub07fG0192000 [Reevesia pubescens]